MNAEIKHTPGPWHVNAILGGRIVGDEKFTNPAPDKLQISNHNATVATVYRARDARLIAAAPELLAALQRIAAADPQHHQFAVLAISEARAAIAKVQP
jgi:hypothetical protein